MIFGGIVLYASYYGCDQSEAQRSLSAKSLGDLKKIIMAASFLRFPITLIYCFAGLIIGTLALTTPEFLAQIPEDQPDWLMPIFIVNYLPKGKRRIFQAEDPSRLLALAEEKQQELEATLASLKTEIIPALRHLKPEFATSNVRFYEGDEGVEYVLKDILSSTDKGDKSYSVISTQALREHLYRPFPTFTKQRIAKGIFVRVLAIGAGGDEAELAERKWMKGEGDASYIAIYPPKVAMISLTKNDFPVAVVIDSDAISGTHQMMFDTLWNAL